MMETTNIDTFCVGNTKSPYHIKGAINNNGSLHCSAMDDWASNGFIAYRYGHGTSVFWQRPIVFPSWNEIAVALHIFIAEEIYEGQ